MKIFVTGASGYIGGSVAALLASKGHAVRGLIRSPAKAESVRAKGIEPVIGTLDDAALLRAEAAAADAVINAADSDHQGAVEALLAGLAGTGKPFIHTSGTSLVGDEAMGEPSEAIFTEETPVKPEPDKKHRVALNRLIMEAAPGVRTIVLCNSLIYGDTLGAPAQSVQIPPLVAQAQESGIARYIGRGLNIWSNVHIADMADLYLLALEKAPAGSFYYVENGEAAFGDLVRAIAKALGLGEAQSWPAEEAIARWGRELAVFALGSNSRVRAGKARSELGWAPTHTSVLEWVKTGLNQQGQI
ncbi:NAD-dependent epimerase/dehydratase family protein [Gluconacetobacter aggeris]|uniref:NAD-dependent epimerase/dehydratase family protein n=1 Tax=Gluconacetobacter aggeris TaxID=1286186 RepID=A0A7W4IVH6_9PROT|nr:NAD-dependent epimerase/dehydratase family protein [Gluconacetobacter aggeris]MBB2169713.1 NAD-dependent epimerase/dehydratase family protein [Gluconacetobacter aggeris]